MRSMTACIAAPHDRGRFVRAVLAGEAPQPLSDLGVQRLEPSGHITSVSREERFHLLFTEHYPAVTRFVRTRGHGSSDAEDLIAGTFEAAWGQMDTLPEGRAALLWLLGVARNLSRNAMRTSGRDASFLNGVPTTTLSSTEMPIEDRASSAEVMSALARLRPVDRDLILLVAWDELSPSEAGQVLGLRPMIARSRLHHARQRMRGLMETPAHGTPPAPVPASMTRQEDGHAH